MKTDKTFDFPGNKLNELIDEFIEKGSIQEVYYKEKIKSSLKKIFPEMIEDHVSVDKLKNGILFLQCESSSWREEIKIRESSISKEINSYLNKVVVKRIKVV